MFFQLLIARLICILIYQMYEHIMSINKRSLLNINTKITYQLTHLVGAEISAKTVLIFNQQTRLITLLLTHRGSGDADHYWQVSHPID